MTSQDYIKVNTSGLDFLALVLQSFNSFDLNVFFQVLFSLFLTVYKGQVRLLYLGKVHSTGLFGLGLKFFLFFSLKSSNGFHVETQIFRRSFIFCYFCLLPWGFDFAPARGRPTSVSDHVMTSQDYIKVEHVRNWLLSSSLAKFQQFWSECFFFQVLFRLFLAVYEGLIQLLYLGAVPSTGLFGLG